MGSQPPSSDSDIANDSSIHHSPLSDPSSPMQALPPSVDSKVHNAEKAFKKACDQIVILNRRLSDLGVRYDRATKTGRRSFRYSTRLRIAVTEGVRNMYYEYAMQKADEINELRRWMALRQGGLFPDNVIMINNSSDDVDMDNQDDEESEDDNVDVDSMDSDDSDAEFTPNDRHNDADGNDNNSIFI